MNPSPRRFAPTAVLSLLALAFLPACVDSPADDRSAPTAGPFLAPQAVVWVGDRVVVANSGYTAAGWADGTLTVIDPATGAVLRRLPTSRPDPQRLVLHDGALFVVNTGVVDTTTDPPVARVEGSIDRWTLGDLDAALAPTQTWRVPPTEGGRVGGPIDLAFAGDRALVTLALANAALLLDPSVGWLRGPDAPVDLGEGRRLGLGSVAAWGDRFLVVDFNSDRLFVVTSEGLVWPCSVDLGRGRDLEGAQSPWVVDDVLYVVLALAGEVRRIELSALRSDAPGCGVVPVTAVAPLGQVPNDLLSWEGALLVVQSGENAVTAYDRRSGDRTATWNLPRGSNPWHAALAPDGHRLAVTEWAADALSILDLEGHEPTLRVGGVDWDEASAGEVGTLTGAPADQVVDAPGAGEGPFRDPARAVNGVRGLGERAGGADVFSLGYAPDDDRLALRWSGRRVRNGPGVDFVVFENGFRHRGGWFMDPIVVELSIDGSTWVTWPHDYLAPDEVAYVDDPSLWVGFAGLRPVALHVEDRPVDPFGPAAGGDPFDLDALPLGDPEAARIRREGFRFVRLVSAGGRTNPDTGAPFPRDAVSDGPDIDGVYGRWLTRDD